MDERDLERSLADVGWGVLLLMEVVLNAASATLRTERASGDADIPGGARVSPVESPSVDTTVEWPSRIGDCESLLCGLAVTLEGGGNTAALDVWNPFTLDFGGVLAAGSLRCNAVVSGAIVKAVFGIAAVETEFVDCKLCETGENGRSGEARAGRVVIVVVVSVCVLSLWMSPTSCVRFTAS